MQPLLQVGPYLLLREVGRGGLGVVYEARDTRDGRRLAFKTLKLPDPRLSRRLEREFRAIGRLDHPGLVRVHDYGLHKDAPYLVMDFVDGTGMLEHLRRTLASETSDPAPHELLRRAAELCRELCSVLGYVHSMGIVHRDIKPSNVLVDGSGRVKLIDFGLVKDQAEDEALTETGMILGTAGYFSPEQLQGRAIDGRSDLYSLGVLLFELCTGRRPFYSETRLGLLRAHLGTPPPRPRSLNAAIPERLEALILRLLEKEAHRRLGTAQEVQAELAGLLPELGGEAAQPAAAPAGPPALPAQARLVGRERELAEIRSRLDRALEGGVELLALSAEAGLGKSRLAEEAATHWRLAGGLVLHGRSHQGDRQAHGLLLPVLRALLHQGPTLQGGPGQTGAGQSTTAPAAGPADELSELLRAALLREPVLLVLEDVHWSDPLSLEALQGLLRDALEAPGKGLGAILSFRPQEAAASEPLERLLRWARREGLLARWTLGPLSESEAGELIASLLGSEASPYFAAWLHRATGGNPALLEGAVRHVLGRGALQRGGSGLWRLELRGRAVPLSEFEEAEMPSAFEVLAEDALELAKLKLADLEPEERDLLEAGALLRGEFGLQSLAGVLGLEELDLLDRLDRLLRRGILVEANAEGDRFRFALEMLRESVTHALTGPRRLLLERRIVAGLEQRHGPEPRGQAAVELAEHAFAARLDEKALRGALRAAAELQRQNLFRDAERLYLRVQELLKKEALAHVLTAEQRLDALEGLAAMKNARGEHAEAYAQFGQLVERCEAAGGRARLARALRGQARAAVRMMQPEVAGPLIERLIGLCRDLEDIAGLGHALNLQAALAFDRGDLAEAEARFRAAASAFRQAGTGEELAGALNNVGYIADCVGRFEEARALFEEALALRRQAPPDQALIRSLSLLASNALRRGCISEARPLVEECEGLARKLGDAAGRLTGLLYKAKLLEAEGRHPEALGLYQQIEAAAERLERLDYRMECRLAACRVEGLEEPARAAAAAEELLAEAARAGRTQYAIQAGSLLAELYLRLGQAEPARRHALSSLEEAHRTGFGWTVPALQAVLSRLNGA
jgi:tetratricopeptide (TPR) repeat protein